MDLLSTPYVQGYINQSAFGAVEATPNHSQTPLLVGPEPQMAMECTKVIALESLQDHGDTPQQWGLNNCLTWSAHYPLRNQENPRMRP